MQKIELIKPSRRILDSIGFGERALEQLFFLPKYDESVMGGNLMGVSYLMAEIYNRKFGEMVSRPPKFNEFNYDSLVGVFEAVSNAFAHGDAKENGLVYALTVAERGVCHGFRDGGDFFKNLDIKEKFEAKEKTGAKNYSPKIKDGSGRGYGVTCIYGSSDLIEVDSEHGILFLAQSRARLFNRKTCEEQ